MDSLYVGIDGAKASFVAAAHDPAGESVWGEFANTPAGFEQWRGRVRAALDEQLTPGVVVVLEPTGRYELALAGFAAAQGWQVCRPNALQVHDWAKSQGRRAKTDRQDARLLARYGAAQPLAAWKPLPRAYSELESMPQRQDDLDIMLQQERNRQAAVVLSLEQSQREIRAAIEAHLKAHPALKAKQQRLLSVSGIGRQTVLHVLVLLARWETLTDGTRRAKGLVAYPGLAPKTHHSRSSMHKPARISRMGNGPMHRHLYLADFGGRCGISTAGWSAAARPRSWR